MGRQPHDSTPLGVGLSGTGADPGPASSPATRGEPVDRGLALALVVVLLLGFALRIVLLHTYPPGLFFDEAANLFDIQRVLGGWHPLYFPANNGREPFFFYWASLFASFLGVTGYALRLAAAVIGGLTLVATFLAAREFFRCWYAERRGADWSAIAATFILSTLYAHLQLSRFGLRMISLPFFLAISFGLLFRGLRRRDWRPLVVAGIFGGLSTYTYISSRIAAAVLVVPPLTWRGRFWRTFVQMVLVGVLWIAVSVPLGIYYLQHPAEVQGHTDDVSILNPANNHGDPVGAVLHGISATLLAFNVRGTDSAEQNLPGRPILDPILSVFFFLGIATLIWGAVGSWRTKLTTPAGQPGPDPPIAAPTGRWTPVGRDRAATPVELRPVVAAFLAVWLLDQIIPSMFAVNPPGFIRMTGALPALALVVALGVGSFLRLATTVLRQPDNPGRATAVPGPPPRVGWLPLGVVLAGLLVSAGWSIHDYFWVWGPSPVAYNWMMGPKVDAAARLKALAAGDRVFLAPLWAQDNTVKFLTQGVRIESFDLGKSLVVPTDRRQSVDYEFPATDTQEAAMVAAELPVAPTEQTLRDQSGRFPLLIQLHLPAAALPPRPGQLVATFGPETSAAARGIALAAVQATPAAAPAGATVTIQLEWLAQRPVPDNYTVFLHLQAGSQTVAQLDRQPTDGSYPTGAWQSGDLVWDRYALTLPANLPPGQYQLVGGMYLLRTLKRLPAYLPNGRAPSDAVPLGVITVSPR